MRGFGEKIRQLGSELTLIGTGSPEQGRGFAQRTESPFRVLVDPQLVGYQAVELQTKLFGGFRVQTLPRMLRAFRQGFRSLGVQGNPHQLGGTFVITTDNDLVYSYISRTLDDRGKPDEIVDALHSLSIDSRV